MAWTIEYSQPARRDLKQVSKDYATRILDFIEEELETAEDPRILGRQLKGYSSTWRFRIGQHRIVAKADNDEQKLVIWVIDHRRSVYQAAKRRLRT